MATPPKPPEPARERRHDEVLRGLLDDTSDLAALVAPDGTCAIMNRSGRRMLGIDADLQLDGAGVMLSSFLTETMSAKLRDDIQPALESGQMWRGTLEVTTGSGREVPVRATVRPLLNREGFTTWVARDISTEKAVAQQLAQRAFHDSLTGLPVSSLFLDRLHLVLTRPSDDVKHVSVLFLNLDRFKAINDNLGHDIGDQVLRSFARRLPESVHSDDTVVRFGGDEFLVLSEHCDSEKEAIDLARRMASSMKEPIVLDGGREVFLSGSIGVAVVSPGEMSPDEVLRSADAAMQLAKGRGGSAIQLFDDGMRERAKRFREVEDDLRKAIERDELTVYYQAEVGDIHGTPRYTGVEALARWIHPEWGFVSPGEFIPVAEATNQIVSLGEWVMRHAMKQAVQWREEVAGELPFMVAINLSARQFVEDDFIDVVASMLKETGARPADICLEITESVVMHDVNATLAKLRSLKDLGVALAIDDFGTGYSSLSYLKQFPVDYLKIDQSFVFGLGDDAEDSAIVAAIIAMSKALNLKTIAEGVETEAHVAELMKLGCDVLQGFHFCRPAPADQITEQLKTSPSLPG